MKITCWSDYACPYCYIGETHLKQAVEALGAAQSVEIEMKAFELNPYASKDYTGTTVDRFAVKYGLTNAMAAKRIQQIDETGRQAGLDFNYGQTRYTSTFDAHRLTKLAQSKPDRTLADRLSEHLYRAYFTENLELADPEVLVRIAVSEGLDETEVRAMLASDDYADDVMKSVFGYYQGEVTGRKNMLGGTYRVNMLPTTCHVYFGDVMMASANGRLAHVPVSEGISPEKGADTNGPTAVIKSCAKMDHLMTGGTLLNQKFTPSVVAGEEGLDQMANLIRSYFNMDGHHIQFNVIDRETLIAAQKNPEEYKDLIVRVAGYSDHFRNLSKALQDEIINRTEQSFN